MMRSHLPIIAAVLLAPASAAQTLYTFDGALTVTELSGPPVGPCAYPNGPVNSIFPAVGVLCPGPAPFLPPLGDIAVNVATDTIYVTNGAVISSYTRFGVHLGTAIPPVPGLTGMAVGAGVLWITTGVLYGAVPLGAGCPLIPLPFVIGPFPVPIGPIFAGPIGDLDFEAASGSLIACDAAGLVGSFMPGPVPVLGPYGVWPTAPAGCVGPAGVGIAFDKALPGTGTVFVCDGVLISRQVPGGLPAPPTFYFPAPGACIPIPGALPKAGLAYAGRQITYGFGLDNSGLPAPLIDAVGQSFLGNGAYAITLTGSVPGSTAFLRYSFLPACPTPFVLGVPLYLGVPRFPLATVIVGAGGTALVPAPIPAVAPIPLSVYLQWIVLTGGSIQVTSGGEFSTVFP
ncbi:MAG: hypothetical protein EXS08_00035 [Planctomycetes bacterium]|nr:hypothetical protein [Planctomycetota bacterium]